MNFVKYIAFHHRWRNEN